MAMFVLGIILFVMIYFGVSDYYWGRCPKCGTRLKSWGSKKEFCPNCDFVR